MFDAISYILGLENGEKIINLDGEITCTDDGDGNITITVE